MRAKLLTMDRIDPADAEIPWIAVAEADPGTPSATDRTRQIRIRMREGTRPSFVTVGDTGELDYDPDLVEVQIFEVDPTGDFYVIE